MKFIKSLYLMFKSGISHFVFAFFGSVVIFILTTIQIFTEEELKNIIRIILALSFAVILSVAAQIVSQRFKFQPRADLIQKLVSALTFVPCYFIISDIFDNSYVVLGYFGILITIIATALFFLITDGNNHVLIPHILKSGLLSAFISLIFFGGITLCLFAVNYLIIEINSIDKYIFSVLAFAGLVLFINLFLSLIPYDESELKIPKAFKIIVYYVAFPIYLLLLVVLYIYLGKILFTLVMPGGQINLFSSFALLFFIFFHFTILQYNTSITSFFNKYGGYVLLPILAMQAVAVYIRVNAYGLTTARWVSILLTLTALIYLIMSLIKGGKYTKYVILFFVAVCIVSSVGPFNLLDVPVYEQTTRLEAVLISNGMLDNGIITPNANISDEDKKKISSSYNALVYEKKAPSYLNNGNDFNKTFGFETSDVNIYPNNDIRYINKYRSYDEIDISGYKKYYLINANMDEYKDRCYVNINGGKYDITEKILLISNDSPDSAMIIAIDDNIMLYLNYLDYSINKDGKIQYFNIEGFAILK